MDVELIRAKVRRGEYVYTQHAEFERRVEDLTFGSVEEALLSCEVLEQYPDTGRGESCLLLGFAGSTPVHIVCGWRGDRVSLVTVYVPRPPKFTDPRSRGR